MISFGALSFIEPWLLLGLLGLPLLWWLLRVTPPAPKQLHFPAIRLLFGLNATEQTSADAPWWLVLLRLVAVALLIVACAHPLMNDNRTLKGQGPLVLVVENGWTAAKGWTGRMDALSAIVDLAGREERGVITVSTAPGADGEVPAARQMNHDDALSWLKSLQPFPWPGDPEAAVDAVEEALSEGPANVVWAGSGLMPMEGAGLFGRLQRYGTIKILTPESQALPAFVAVERGAAGHPTVRISRASDSFPQQLAVLARGADGRVLMRQDVTMAQGEKSRELALELPQAIETQLAYIEVQGERHAGAVYLLDTLWDRVAVGLAQNVAAGSSLTLLSDNYYLTRALAPEAEMSQAPVDILVRSGQGMIVLPDAVALAEEEREMLDRWTRDGGVLVRFAGPRLSHHPDDGLLPVTLRQGGRIQDGAMQWGSAVKLGAFSDDGPFAGLEPSEDVTVTRQVLAQPGPDLAARTWAELDDGTPLVTGRRLGKGWLVLFHTTANADWSSLALSGLFVEMLERLGRLSSSSQTTLGDEIKLLPPLKTLDAFGELGPPLKSARALPVEDGEDGAGTEGGLSALFPPGLYGSEGFGRAVNVMDHMTVPERLSDIPPGVELDGYRTDAGFDLQPWLLVSALLLVLLDAWLSLYLRGQLTAVRTAVPVLALILVGIVQPGSGQAQQTVISPAAAPGANNPREAFALAASGGTALAYVVTGNDQVDRISQEGLEGLGRVLNQRTAVEATQPIGVDLVQDDLSFFPLLYWPITPDQPDLSRTAVENLNQFMAAGGTILIDTRSKNPNSLLDSERSELWRLTRGLDIPPLTKIPAGHVLTKSFYLLQEFPGRWQDGGLWVEPQGRGANDGVSRMVIGNADWAGAWALDSYGRPRFATVPGGERQREIAYRFGVNLVMYMLTGNYKADQVHVPAILERLGQ
ncbi:DUF4159 domain-containing protein [Aestuariispira insulae]|uniref:Putative membrane protein (TIGR02226 family) n=1 Tax=Aestuariispira insulae TaxID=1461337 RepID=A0A3D9HGA7_9PROT|nr:DUF4159 domain-containing protein [Aestuariispira insulae]RED48026.1 putative membrane protein (TIGR02226 family) [Aestuariispira insulae]